MDNEFASRLHFLTDGPMPAQTGSLCDKCQLLDPKTPGFSVQYRTAELKSRSAGCDLCRLFWIACQRRAGEGLSTVRFSREKSTLRMNNSGPPVLHVYRDPGMKASDEECASRLANAKFVAPQ